MMPSDTFTGQCHGGPDNGKLITHWANHYVVLKPMAAFAWPPTQDPVVEAVPIGTYHFANGLWLWHVNGGKE